jgi:lipoprotein-releasing system permease protein
VSIRCVPADVFERDPGFRSFITIKAGSPDLSRTASILASSALASSLGITVGETVSLLTTYEENMGGLPRVTQVLVAGIYETGYQELDKTLVFAPLALSERALSPLASRALVGIKVRHPFGDLGRIVRDVAAAVGGDARVATWSEIEYARLSSFRTTKALLLFIMALVVVVASVNVSSSVLMILFERRYDLGILKSVGAGPRSLALSFLFSGLATGILGTAAGVAAGLLVAVNINQVIAGLEWAINAALAVASFVRSSFVPSAPAFGGFTLFNSAYYLKSIPINIDVGEVAAAAIAALLLAALASYVPAARAARTRPLEILRKV